jgi:hypothetical protein
MKITLSKSQWEFIGRKTGWIKSPNKHIKISQNDTVEIDGKLYALDENGEIVEATKEPAKSVTLEVSALGGRIQGQITFTEGQEYQNYYGIYKVNKINNDTIEVVYTHSSSKGKNIGDQETYPMRGQAEAVLANQHHQKHPEYLGEPAPAEGQSRTEERQAIVFDRNEDYYFLAGYVAKNGFILAEVPPNALNGFSKKYKTITDKNPQQYLGTGFRPQTTPGWWGASLRIFIPEPQDPEAKERINNSQISDRIQNLTQSNSLRISSNKFVWQLINDGFELGENHGNIGSIFANVPEDYQTSFQSGLQAT